MENKRDSGIYFKVSDYERGLIHQKMELAGIRNMSAYIRKMAIDGYTITLDLTDVKEMVSLLRRCSNNLNQYAKYAHQTGGIYASDMMALQKQLDDIWGATDKILRSLASIPR